MLTRLAERYLTLLKKSLLNDLYIENDARIIHLAVTQMSQQPQSPQDIVGAFRNIRQSQIFATLEGNREVGAQMLILEKTQDGRLIENVASRNFTANAHTMIGRQRMNHLHWCLDQITAEGIAGDLIETGVWRGGATIFMRGYLAAHDIADRTVWAADSFEGLPPPTLRQDAPYDFSKDMLPYLAISLEDVQALFERYGLLDAQVRFLKGWFKDTLPGAPIEQLALLRLDGDLYESTMDALNALYHKVAPGGFVVVDDYESFPPCKIAIEEFRQTHGITQELIPIDKYSVYWRKPL
ncbi:TylF/MycF/NovP-related O-methyltransferase [Parachitinimonas caeni]|uniref:TylF/MycF/NovP-related O-methyltransferase n=1 Tax=Parachitinimonas caeni TaxID=3031301 RepID=A0ABT7DYW7_9NEIS|nr:TylF/MycF/NovP-related O-methyltransferase [Parachitinimonas caeni]MDK2124345.1 TylF/MycF/NovP-related O-methyltransferase [Parachitinimonas caeni]